MKPLIIIALALAIFGGAAYSTYRLYLKPREELQQEKQRGPAPLPPDPTLPEFEKRVQAQESQSLVEARASWSDFIEHYPESSRINDAKNFLGRLNAAVFLSPVVSAEKQVYLVKPGDVITRVATKMKTTPELLMRSNNLTSHMLRIGQKLVISPSDFSLFVDRRQKKVVLLNGGKFFKQYDILAMPQGSHPTPKAATPRPAKVLGKVTDRLAWFNSQRLTYAEKDYPRADHWVVISPGGHTIYSEHPVTPGSPPLQKPPAGYGVAPEDARELSALLQKNDPATID